MGEVSKNWNISKYVNRVNLSFLYCIYVMLLSGSYYAFSSYGKELASKLDYTQTQANVVSSVSAIFSNGSAIFGIILDRFNFRFSIIFAGIIATLGYVLAGFACQMKINYHYTLVTLYIGLVNLGNMGAYLTGLKVNNANVTQRLEGVLSGILVASYGLSAVLVSLIYTGVGSVDRFMYVMSAITGASFLLGSLVMYVTPKRQENNDDEIKDKTVLVSSLPGRFSTKSFLSWHLVMFVLNTGMAPAAILTVQSTAWSQIYSYQYENSLSPYIATIIFSICSCIGRFASGLIVFIFAKRMYFATLGIVASSATFVLLVFQMFIDSYIFFAIFMAGLGFVYGIMLTAIPVSVRNYFGFKRFGIYLSLSLSPLSLVLALYSFISGRIYDSLVNTTDKKCVGKNCYLYTYIMLAFFAMIGIFINIWLLFQEKSKTVKESKDDTL